MYLNVFGLKKEERNITEAVKHGSHQVANVRLVSQQSLERLQKI